MRGILVLCLVLAVFAVSAAERTNWVLLIAGSAGYLNYRHQSDVCHAYQIMHKAGVPDENMVVMMVDDVANNKENPYKGNIINQPGGPNVYEGVLKDYTGTDVNAKTFLAVLSGDKKEAHRLTEGRNNKVIDSGPEDYVFVNYVDHGGPGILGMPKQPYLKATDLIKTLKKMHKDKKFAKLVFFVESCESGSIFDKLLPEDIDIYATTAANPKEPSFACYHDLKRKTFLGDYYSVNWMQDTEKSNTHDETFAKLYKYVKKHTNRSHVEEYGDLTLASDVLDSFFGEAQRTQPMAFPQNTSLSFPPITDAVPSDLSAIYSLKARIENEADDSELRSRLEGELQDLQTTKSQTQALFWDIAATVHSDLPFKRLYDTVLLPREDIQNYENYYTALDTLLSLCPGLDLTQNDFVLRQLYILVNLSNNNQLSDIIQALTTATVTATANGSPLCQR